jgi:hypothetical protein
MFCLSSLLLRLLEHQPDAIRAVAGLAIVVGLVLSGLVLGVVGLWLGLKHSSFGAIAWSVLGILINGVILVLWTCGAILRIQAG